MIYRTRSLVGHIAYRTSAPALVRLARHRIAAEAGFIALVLGTGFALDGLAGIVIAVFKQFAN